MIYDVRRTFFGRELIPSSLPAIQSSPTRPRGRSGGRLPALDLDLPKINHPYFSKSASWLQSRGFLAVWPVSTGHPPITSYIYTPSYPLLCYLYHISILPLYTLVGWTDSQNKLKTSDLACPPTQNLHWTLVGQIILPWTKSKILPLHFSSTQYQAICSLDNLSSSRIGGKMAKIETI